jgi:concentrative nucleoside transporter, CNT family
LLVFVNGTLVWIFRGFGVKALDLHQVVAGPLYPLSFFLGMPRNEIFNLAYIVSGKLLVSSDFAYASLAKIMASSAPFSARGFSVISFALANTASLGAL